MAKNPSTRSFGGRSMFLMASFPCPSPISARFQRHLITTVISIIDIGLLAIVVRLLEYHIFRRHSPKSVFVPMERYFWVKKQFSVVFWTALHTLCRQVVFVWEFFYWYTERLFKALLQTNGLVNIPILRSKNTSPRYLRIASRILVIIKIIQNCIFAMFWDPTINTPINRFGFQNPLAKATVWNVDEMNISYAT